MKSRLLPALFFCFALITQVTFAQTDKIEPQRAIATGTLNYKFVPSITEQIKNGTFIPADAENAGKEINKRLRHGVEIIPGKGSTGPDPLAQNQKEAKTIPGKMPSLVFTTTTSTSTPSDPTGAVGLDFYVAAWNLAFGIWNKDGTVASPAASLATIFGSTIGDPIVFYDGAADRYVITQFADSPNGFEVAVSQTNDPVNDGWHVYSSTDFSTGAFPDYTKFSVWRDGYYVTANISGGTGQIFAIERDQMLNGLPSTIQAFNLPGFLGPVGGFYSPQVFHVTDDNLPTTGGATIVYQQDDAYPGVAPGNDHFKLWNLDIDWAVPVNSMISAPTEFPVASFNGVFDGGNFDNLTQPTGGPDIDALQALIANVAQFRKFGTYNSAVFSHVVDEGSGSEQAGIRWYELRQTGDGQPWTLYQQGTFVDPDGKHAWNGSIAMDADGNIALGFTSMGSSPGGELISTRYTGQTTCQSGTGIMNIDPVLIQTSTGINPSLRYADYSHLTVDPTDDDTFWFVNEIFTPNRSNVVGVFDIDNPADDVGVTSIDAPTDGALGANETIMVTVTNFGSNAASGFDVTYQIDGGSIITESFVGSIAACDSASFSFATTADLSSQGTTYSITSCTVLGGDEDNGNDCTTQNVTSLSDNDVGVTAFTSPVSGYSLGNETVTVTIENFGTADQTGFDVNYIIDGGTPVVETVGVNVPAGGTVPFTFTATADLSTIGSYNFTSSTLLAGDQNNGNNMAATVVENTACDAQTNSTSMPVGPDFGDVTNSVITFTNDFVIDDANVTINVDHTWDGDMTIELVGPGGTPSVTLADQIGASGDNYTDTTFDDEAGIPITSGSPPFTGTFQPSPGSLAAFDTLNSIGDWTLRITDNANQDGGTLNYWTLELCPDPNLSIDDPLVEDGLTIIYEENNHFLVKLPTSSITERLGFRVYNTLGQTIYYSTLENESGSGYEHRLNMSYMAAGVYFVRIGDGIRSNTQRIVVR